MACYIKYDIIQQSLKIKCIDLTKLMSAIGINIKLKSIFGVMPKLFIYL